MGRFINTVDEGEEPNCRAETILIPNERDDDCELGVVYISKKDLKAGQELTVRYPLKIANEAGFVAGKLVEDDDHSRSINRLYKNFPI